MNIKLIGVLAVVVGAALGTLAFFNFTPFHDAVMNVAGSPAGSTFNTAKYAGKVVVPATAGADATTTSILNSDAGDRYITGVRVGCETVGTSKTAYSGAGLASLTLTIGTSSAANPATASSLGSTVGGTALTIGTSTAFYAISSSTTGVNNAVAGTNNIANIWAAGSYLSAQFNATNTAACTWGVDYIGS